MKRILIIISLFSLLAPAYAQVQSVRFNGISSIAVEHRIEVTKALSYGGNAEVQIGLGEGISLFLQGGFETFAIDQTDELNKWNWKFWNERYRGNVSAQTRDTLLTAVLNPVQTMDVVSFSVSAGYRFSLSENFQITPIIGAGVMFYARKLYHEETWSKTFPGADNYTFTYTFRNFAPYKYGNPVFASLGLNASWLLGEIVSLQGYLSVKEVIQTPDLFGFSNFPFRRAVNGTLGIGFHY